MIVETSGIGQGDAAIVPLVDVPVYVMTPEFGAASQLEKIDMLDFAEFVAINKFDRKGAADALRDVAKQVQRNREAFSKRPDEMPVFGTMASRFNDDGVTALYQALKPRLAALGLNARRRPAAARSRPATARTRCRSFRRSARATSPTSPTPCAATSAAPASRRAWRARSSSCAPAAACCRGDAEKHRAREAVAALADEREATLDARSRRSCWRCGPRCSKAYAGDEYVVKIRDKEIRTPLVHTTLSGSKIRKVALPPTRTTARS